MKMRDAVEMLTKLVNTGNKFRYTSIVDDDFPGIRNEFDSLLGEATKMLGDSARCEYALAAPGTTLIQGRCVLKKYHKGSCTNLKATWTDRSNW